jgi:hypothetical protein
MIEFIVIVTISVIILIFFRPGKTPPLNNSLVIERGGHYHVTLSPQLNLAQPYIEAIAREIGTAEDAAEYSQTLCFEITDVNVAAHGQKSYLLAITKRNGMLYIQATSPVPGNVAQLSIIGEFADNVLARYPAIGAYNPALDDFIIAAIERVGSTRKNIRFTQLEQ